MAPGSPASVLSVSADHTDSTNTPRVFWSGFLGAPPLPPSKMHPIGKMGNRAYEKLSPTLFKWEEQKNGENAITMVPTFLGRSGGSRLSNIDSFSWGFGNRFSRRLISLFRLLFGCTLLCQVAAAGRTDPHHNAPSPLNLITGMGEGYLS